MHWWPRSIRDSLDCCQPSWLQTTSRLRSHRLRTYCTSPVNPLRTTVTSFCGPVLPMRPPELVRSIVTKTIRSSRIPHSPDRLLQIPHIQVGQLRRGSSYRHCRVPEWNCFGKTVKICPACWVFRVGVDRS